MIRHRPFSTLALSLSSVLLASQIAVAQQTATASETEAQRAASTVLPHFRQFVHIANDVNIFGNFTVLDHPDLNGHPEAIVYATVNSTPDGRSGIYNEHPIGVWYDEGKWTVFTQDLTPMPVGAAFTIRVGGGFRHHVTASNSLGIATTIDNPLTNNNPNAILLVTLLWDTLDSPVYVNHNIGVLYSPAVEKWTITLAELDQMPEGASFNVLVGKGLVHTAGEQNTIGNRTLIDSQLTNGRPEAKLLVTYNVSATSNPDAPVNDHPIGVFYDGQRWSIANQDQVDIANGAAFNVFVANPPKVTNAFFSGKKLVVEVEGVAGEGAVLVNGVLPPLARLDLANQKVIVSRMSKAIPVGATATIEVQDEDGVRSDAFSFTRQ
jgi:hypothetical protein